MTDIHIQTEAQYAAIYDEAGPANTAGFIETQLDAARQVMDAKETEARLASYYLERQLISCASRGELLAWALPFNGTFKVAIEYAPPLLQDRNDGLHLEDVLPHTADLVCPSGRLKISCVSKLGVPLPTAAVSVEPGAYRVSLLRNEQQEALHFGLDGSAQYPATDGPDWIFTLQRLQGQQR
ncbi:hypothetical protein ACO0LO_05690 [Undibacterium sp. TJN25]|uniref:hypothetical protein n=1 Tax=Undibacterium sp. TJN25 TaxID=3413056 RepID=UPI003BEF6FE7